MSWLNVFSLDLAVVALGLMVLLFDAFARLPGRAMAGGITLVLLLLLAMSWQLDLNNGLVPYGVYEPTEWVLFFKRLFLVAGALGVLGSADWLEKATPHRQAEYYALMLFSLAGMMLIPGARDWIFLVVAFELMGVPLIVLAAWAKQDVQPVEGPKLAAEAALKLFVTSAASSAVTLFGVALVTGLTGTSKLAAVGAGPVAPLLGVGMLMVLGGFGFKVGAVPFHFWVPDTYQGAPTPFVAFLSVAPKAGGLAALAVVLLGGWGGQAGVWGPALAVISAASMVVGNLFALPQQDARRLLGFSGIAQIGYVLVALVAGTEQGLAMALFFIATYVFTNLGVFLVVHAAAEESGGHTFTRLLGLSRRAPVLGAALLVFLLSLAGIPFVVGFWAKLFVFLAAWKAGLEWLVLTGVVLAVVGLFYYLSVARSTFMAEGESSKPVHAGFLVKVAIGACLLAVLGFGLYPKPLVEQANLAAYAFFATRGH